MTNNGTDYSEYKYFTTHVDPNFEKNTGGGGGSGCLSVIVVCITFIAFIAMLSGGDVVAAIIVFPIILVLVLLLIWISNKAGANKEQRVKNAASKAAYKRGKKYYKANQFDLASKEFSASTYLDSSQLKIYCQGRHFEVIAEEDPKHYLDAYRTYKSLVLSYEDSPSRLENTRRLFYEYANKCMSQADYDEAYQSFFALDDYLDSEQKAKQAFRFALTKNQKLLKQKGSTFLFGHYMIDDEYLKPIEWIVVAVDGNYSLLLSKYALAYLPFDKERNSNRTWEKCSLRQWLNKIFLNRAFSTDEQSYISSVVINSSLTDRASHYPFTQQKEKSDTIFLLSRNDIHHYNIPEGTLKCRITKNAFPKIALGVDNNTGYCEWWLRSTSDQLSMSGIMLEYYHTAGFIDHTVPWVHEGVRPAFWINTKSISLIKE